jgi:hypothetical protein
MFMGLGMPIPDLSSKPGPGRPGYPTGAYEFKFEVTDNVTFKAIANSAGTFSISYPDGTTTTTSGSSSITSQGGAGIISINKEDGDTTFCDEFAIVGNKDRVIKVISWGQRTWNKLQDAFKDCTNLTDISTTSLTTDTLGNLNNLFSGCTSLTDVSIKGWNLLNGCSIEGLFDGCTNIEKLDATGLALKIKANSRFAFRQIGSNVANGCEFLMSGLDFSTSTAMQLGDTFERGMFKEVKIKPNSNFSNWNLTSSATTTFNFAFASAKLLGDNSILNISNWTFAGTTGSRANNFFQNLETSDSTNRGLNIDITNWNFGNIYNVSYFFSSCDLSTVTGLSTLTASNLTNIAAFFQYTRFLSIDSSDNLSSSFRNAVNVTGNGVAYFTQSLGSELANESDWGAFPNMDGMSLSGSASFTSIFTGARFSTGINLGNVTFPTVARSYSGMFNAVRLSAGNGIDLTTTTLKSSSFQQMFQQTSADFVKMGPGIDWSSVTVMYGFNYLFNYYRPGGAVANSIELPTGLNISSLSNIGLWGIDANYSQCQIDNFIRSMWLYQRPPVPSTPTLNFSGGTGLTAAPMAVRSKVDDLITAGWNFNGEVSPDITAPFAYTGSFLINTDITPTINTSGGTFSSSDVTVNSATGTFNTSTAGSVTIKYTLPNGCYNEQVLSVVPPFRSFKFRVTGPISIKAQPAATGSFTIDWGDGTSQTTTGGTSIASPSYPAGTYDVQINAQGDNTYCDDFAIVSGQTNVTKVLDWGEKPWSNMYLAFDGCTSLSDISTTSFISSSNQSIANKSMIKMFNGCTSLLEADIRNWDLTAGVDWNGGSPFNGLVNLQKLDMTGMSIKILTRGTGAFAGIGTAVTNGCEFLMSGIDWSTTTGTYWQDFFTSAKINPNSDLSNWVFPSSSVTISRFFRGGSLAGVNSTLNMSGWSTLPNTGFYQFFQNFNSADSPDTDQGMKINISNINVSGASDFRSMFEGCDVTEIIGLSTLGASSAANANLNKFADNARFLKFSSSDNFSNAFIASLNPSDVNEAFQYCGASLSSNFGAAPNLTNINLSNITSLSSTFEGAKFYDAPDLSTATFSSTGVSFGKTFKSMQTENSNTHIDFSNVSIKISNAREMFNSARVDNVTFGNNVDFSLCTDVYRKFNDSDNKSGTINITYPTAESGLSWAALTQPLQWFTNTTGPTTGPLTTCQVDNLIRSFHNTALNSGLTVDFGLSKITQSPSVVSTMVNELENTGGWNITPNTLDATIPFEYTGTLAPNTIITPTNNTGSPFTGTKFSSTNSNIAVNATTGVINTSNVGNTTIRYTLDDGCYTEQAISLVPTGIANNYSMDFNPADSTYIKTGKITSLDTGDFSVSIWLFRRSGQGNLQYVISNSSNTDNAGFDIVTFKQTVKFERRTLTKQASINYYDIGLSYNTWHNIVGTYNDSTGDLKLYLDGVLKTTASASADTNEPSFDLNLGRSTDGLYLLNGKLDEVAIWDTELTSTQIQSIYNATSTNLTKDLTTVSGSNLKYWNRMGD